ncbi:UNVERIFIED_CONTAM: hypothetical protein Sradi_7226300 [Sesamum radiatum]|uniref:Uncharacterized protein n=1 Tax=Sesamum radiatum TaxID=300843 RepID=A0AAW2IMT4_SESRA
MYGVVRKLKALKGPFRALRREQGDVSDNVRGAKDFLEKSQSLFDEFKDDLLLQLVQCCRITYCKAVQVEAAMLRQRAKLKWVQDGDQCSKVFFGKINSRRARQRVHQILSSDGTTATEPDQVAAKFINFFQTLLGGARQRRTLNLDVLKPHLKHSLTVEEAAEMVSPVTQAEVRDGFFEIDEDSAPGPDGFSSGFYKAAWPEIGTELFIAVAEFFESGRLLKQLNATLLVLIPKTHCLPGFRISAQSPAATFFIR